MNTKHIHIGLAVLVAALATSGCGPSTQEIDARERERLELERKAAQETDKANKAISEMNKNMFGRMNSSTPGESNPEDENDEKKPTPPAESEKTPDETGHR